jgi:hypothetical protein
VENVLRRLERRFGSYAVERLAFAVACGMVAVFLFVSISPSFVGRLTLDLERVRAGEVWRLFSFILLPTSRNWIWFFFGVLWFASVGQALEDRLGAFRFNVYYLLGMLGTLAAALITGAAVGNLWLNSSLILAFATLFPDYPVRLYFVLEVRMKWIGVLTAGVMVFQAISASWADRAALVAALSNYFLFFGEELVATWRGRRIRVRQEARRVEAPVGLRAVVVGRTCAVCGALQTDGADIRVCSCATCKGLTGGTRELCLDHARNH